MDQGQGVCIIIGVYIIMCMHDCGLLSLHVYNLELLGFALYTSRLLCYPIRYWQVGLAIGVEA